MHGRIMLSKLQADSLRCACYIIPDDPGLRFVQLQPSLTKKGRELGDDIGRQNLTRRCRHHQIVGIADQADAMVEATAPAWSDVSTLIVFGSEEPLHAVECGVGAL